MNTITLGIPDGVTTQKKRFGLGETFILMVDNQVVERKVSKITLVRNASGMFLKYNYDDNGIEHTVNVRNMFSTKEELAASVLGIEIPPPVQPATSRFDKEEALKLEILSEIKSDLGLTYAGGDEDDELLEIAYLAWIRGKHGSHSTKYKNVTERTIDSINEFNQEIG